MASEKIQNNFDKKDLKQIYNSSDNGMFWGWRITFFIWTKTLSAGTFFMFAFCNALNRSPNSLDESKVLSFSAIFMIITGILFIINLERSKKVLYFNLNSQLKFRLLRGDYIIAVFSLIIFLSYLRNIYGYSNDKLLYPSLLLAFITITYTSFSYGKEMAGYFWHSPWFSSAQVFIQSAIAGSFVLTIVNVNNVIFLQNIFQISILLNLLIIFKDIVFHDETPENLRTLELITRGYFSKHFWLGIVIGNILPLGFSLILYSKWFFISGILSLFGIFLTEYVRITVAQQIYNLKIK